MNVSKPIVPFRETIVLPPKLDMVNESIQDQGDKEDINEIIQVSFTKDINSVSLLLQTLFYNTFFL